MPEPKQIEQIYQIIHAAIRAVDPEAIIRNSVRLQEGVLTIQDSAFPLAAYERLFVIAVGKAAYKMAKAVETVTDGVVAAGVVITKHLNPQDTLPEKYQLFVGGHPVPNGQSVAGAQAAAALAENAGEKDLILCLISGGGSALMTLPEQPITFEDMVKINKLLLGSGADITEFNAIRKHLDQVKGGKLALKAAPATICTCILSDIVGNPLDAIASGPTVPDPNTFADCLKIIEKYALSDKIPASVLSYLEKGQRGDVRETMKNGALPSEKNQHFLLGDNEIAARGAAEQARALGFHAEIANNTTEGEAKNVGKNFAEKIMQPVTYRPNLEIFGGETTVTLTGKGLGGRNMETALAAVKLLDGIPNVALVTLATDGEDGPTDAAGAIVTGDTYRAGLALGAESEAFLAENDSYHFFEKAGGLIQIGSTGTNVNDLNFLFCF